MKNECRSTFPLLPHAIHVGEHHIQSFSLGNDSCQAILGSERRQEAEHWTISLHTSKFRRDLDRDQIDSSKEETCYLVEVTSGTQ